MLIKNAYRFLVLGAWDGKSGWMEWRLLNSPTFSRYALLLTKKYYYISTFAQGGQFTCEEKNLKSGDFL
jgi:hypothetical protein